MTFAELYEELKKRGRSAKNWHIDFPAADPQRADKCCADHFLAVRSADKWQIYYVDIRGPLMIKVCDSEAELCRYIFEQCCSEEWPNPAIMARYWLKKLKYRLNKP